MSALKINLEKGFQNFQPHFVIYNAGTDILKGDRLGELNISPQGVIQRDKIVFD